MALSVVYSACSEVPEGVIGDANASGGTSGVSGASGTAGASGSATGGTGTGATGNGGASMGATGGSGVGGTGGTGTGGVGALGGGGATGGTGGSTTGGTGGDLGGGGASGTGPQLDDATCTAFPQQNERAKFITENHPDAVSHLPSQLSDKIRMLSGTTTSACNWQCFDAFGVPSSNIPEFRMRDGPRGVRGNAAPYDNGTKTTAFAVAEARAASFDLELEYKIGQAMAAELRALRRDILLAPTINTLRHPRWARAQETYGEDPVLVGEMGAAFTKGHQDGPAPGLGMPACPKHYVGNDTDENRGGGNETRIVDVRYDSAQTLHENYLRPFEITVEKADPACIMAAYNKVDGELSSQNKHILVDILRTAWKWKGFTVSDWWATGSGAASPSEGPTILGNGLDCEMPTNEAFAGLGSAQSAQVDIAAKRILDARASFGQLTAAYISAHDQNPDTSVVAANADLARESSEKGAILLQNDGILPLGKQVGTLGTPTLTSIIVLGPDANVPVANTDSGAHGLGDRGSSNNVPPHAVSFTQGLKDLAPQGVTVTSSGNAGDAAGKDIVIIPVTMAHEDEGEAYSNGGDRDDMTLSGNHPAHWSPKPAAFINQVYAVNPNIIVLLAVGSAVIDSDGWMGHARAIVQPFYPGQEGGTAVAKLLYGALNFSGKLPFTVATSEDQYPAFGNAGTSLTVDYLHGYRRFEANSQAPKWWFGFGMSYTTYAYSELKVLCTSVSTSGRLNAQVTVTNTGMMAGDEIVQAYVSFPDNGKLHPPKELKAFTRVHLEPGASAVVPITIPARDLRYYGTNDWAFDLGTYKLRVGPSADPASLQSADFTLN